MPYAQMKLLLKGRRGFSLVEMILVVAVMSILLTVSMPSLYQFIRQRDIQGEENAQLEIRKALQAYLADHNKLPAETTWSADLAGYTNMSQAQIANDVWGRPRAYIMYMDPSRNLQGSAVEIYYATLHSAGADGIAQAAQGNSGIAVNGTAFADGSSTLWWSNRPGQQVNLFSTIVSGKDDIMLRFTDYPEKLERYNLTLQRLDRLAETLESYAKNGYANKVVACSTLTKDPNTGLTGDATCDNGAPERIIYYPRSLAIANPTDLANYYNSTVYVDNSQTDAARRANMQGLMRLLGLPDDFCCSALSLGSDDLPKPFYYFSNPRPRLAGGGCAGRPDANSTKLPARLTTVNDDTAATNPTCG